MNGLIRASLRNPFAVTVGALTIMVLGVLCLFMVPIDILPVFKSPAVQTLTFYGGMPATSIEKDITNRMERWTGQANGKRFQESRSIVGASIVRNYFYGDVDPNGALTQVNSLALSTLPNLPPGTLPPVVLPFDPTSTTPVSVVALDSRKGGPSGTGWGESILYDVGRYEVRNMIMGVPGAVAPVVFGGKIRAVMAYLDRAKMQARGLSPVDVMRALDNFNVFLPTGDAKFGTTDYAIDSNSLIEPVVQLGDIPLRTRQGNRAYIRDLAEPMDASFIQTNIVRVNGRKQVYIPVYRQLGASTLSVVQTLRHDLPDYQARLSRDNINLQLVMDQSVYVRKSIESLVQEGLLGAVLCSLVILVFLGEWRMTAIAVLDLAAGGYGGDRGPVLQQQHDQRDDARRARPGDRSADRHLDHLPGEHAPAPQPGRVARACRVHGCLRGVAAGAGGEPLHLAGAGAAGVDAGPGRVPVPADGAGGHLRDGLGLHPLAIIRALACGRLAPTACLASGGDA